ncbi:chloramphenicol acetyltransferase [Euzebyella saccharophila]|uniref:CatA-like O-acetyltransferase n=1 Tax=Euzebyella saccharophila TaxID=679664 RepID=A0ABV8JU88_9FLAO|nr:chloramphenicol acetyltransferase [Euzebyella saccharophila]
MKREIEIKNWNRKDHFEFFSQFDEPFFGVTVRIDCTEAYEESKKYGYSFFLYYLHKALMAANEIASFKYRISEGKVFEYDFVNGSPTINRENGTFGFSYIEYQEDFKMFCEVARIEMERVRNSTGLMPAVSGENVIHFSSLPWIDFTSISHARHFKFMDSCPKISFGKMTEMDGKRTMPISVHVHHALMDGLHVGQFIERFQEMMSGVNG